jgi:hypothetical protein
MASDVNYPARGIGLIGNGVWLMCPRRVGQQHALAGQTWAGASLSRRWPGVGSGHLGTKASAPLGDWLPCATWDLKAHAPLRDRRPVLHSGTDGRRAGAGRRGHDMSRNCRWAQDLPARKARLGRACAIPSRDEQAVRADALAKSYQLPFASLGNSFRPANLNS